MSDEHREQIIPYATPSASRITARDVFGVVVRTAGLGMALYGVYCVFYLFAAVTMNAPLDGSRKDLFTYSAFLLVLGLALLRGEWVVHYAYGPPRDGAHRE